MSRIWLRPPLRNVTGRLGLAHRRSLATLGVTVTVLTLVVARGRGAALGAECTCRPAVAGAVGAGSFLGRPSSRLTCACETWTGLGTGYSRASLARCP